jgi:hypothetical protein
LINLSIDVKTLETTGIQDEGLADAEGVEDSSVDEESSLSEEAKADDESLQGDGVLPFHPEEGKSLNALKEDTNSEDRPNNLKEESTADNDRSSEIFEEVILITNDKVTPSDVGASDGISIDEIKPREEKHVAKAFEHATEEVSFAKVLEITPVETMEEATVKDVRSSEVLEGEATTDKVPLCDVQAFEEMAGDESGAIKEEVTSIAAVLVAEEEEVTGTKPLGQVNVEALVDAERSSDAQEEVKTREDDERSDVKEISINERWTRVDDEVYFAKVSKQDEALEETIALDVGSSEVLKEVKTTDDVHPSSLQPFDAMSTEKEEEVPLARALKEVTVETMEEVTTADCQSINTQHVKEISVDKSRAHEEEELFFAEAFEEATAEDARSSRVPKEAATTHGVLSADVQTFEAPISIDESRTREEEGSFVKSLEQVTVEAMEDATNIDNRSLEEINTGDQDQRPEVAA